MDMPTPNGCLCHALPAGRTCLACLAREKQKAKGLQCRRCGVGLFEQDYTREGDSEAAQGLCSECRTNEFD